MNSYQSNNLSPERIVEAILGGVDLEICFPMGKQEDPSVYIIRVKREDDSIMAYTTEDDKEQVLKVYTIEQFELEVHQWNLSKTYISAENWMDIFMQRKMTKD